MTALLKVQGLTRYFGGLKAVSDLSLEVYDREIVGLIGPNGAGKTTAVNLISGVLSSSSGTVHFDSKLVNGLKPSQLSRMGLVRTFQQTAVYSDRTVRENATRATFLSRYPGFFRSLVPTSANRVRAALADEKASELLRLFGLNSQVDVVARDLPYGYQKILGIVIALAVGPRLILLDEPVAGLSAAETDMVRKAIVKVRDSGVSVVVIEHNMRFIAGLCDRVVVIAHGQPLAAGTPQNVLRDPRVIEAYLGRSHSHVVCA
jgi:branched-chain amino acid transport system ATP-binding protein